MLRLYIVISILIGIHFSFSQTAHTLRFNHLPVRWDEALPLGNGLMGTLIWQKENNLRLSLDHAGLWDQRPMAGLNSPGFNYNWVRKKVLEDQYKEVQIIGDEPYEREPAPSKLPGAALEIESKEWGTVKYAEIDLQQAIATVTWANGIKMKAFMHADESLGYLRFENCHDINIKLLPPKYQGATDLQAGGSVTGDDLVRLGYTMGKVKTNGNHQTYLQKCWGNFWYKVNLGIYRIDAKTIECIWTITTSDSKRTYHLDSALHFKKSVLTHIAWWDNFWGQSGLQLPDSILERQWYLEMYKLGSTARANTPPISLQAIWTADNGRLPPWKGDYHHDLNTQLSYWPAYTANHLNEAEGYINHLEKNKNKYQKFTNWYFNNDGLNVPGVTTLDGSEMGGWIQYSMSPTISAWLTQHYYLQWRYSMDTLFLKKRLYPWIKQVATHLEKITYLDAEGLRQLPLSSSPEYYNNSKEAWFLNNTNYDLSLMKYVFSKAVEIAHILKKEKEAIHYSAILNQFSSYAISKKDQLMVAKDHPYEHSHRHFSHLMAIHPLGEIKWENGEKDQSIIRNSLALLDSIGTSQWCGYSFAWEGNLKARAKDGLGASKALNIFATCFCSPNSFHLNGDQSKTGKSDFIYRPFTLEGNFAFASAVQEMLLQSYAGFIEVFPAIPLTWENVSFRTLRSEGAFLVSAKKEQGHINEVILLSEKGGSTILKLPFEKYKIEYAKNVRLIKKDAQYLSLDFKKGGKLELIRNTGN